MVSFANTPAGKSQAKRFVECRISLGCSSAKDFYLKYGKNKGAYGEDLFSYPQYQKYESGERIIGRKAAIQFAKIFNKDWEWLQNGYTEEKTQDDEFLTLTEEEKEIIRALRKVKSSNEVSPTTKAG